MMQCNGDLNALIEIQITDDNWFKRTCIFCRLLIWVRVKASLLCRGCAGKMTLLDDR